MGIDLQRRRSLQWGGVLALFAAAGMTGCGFELRQAPQLQFQRLFLIGSSSIFDHLRRGIKHNRVDVVIVDDPMEAEAFLEIISDRNVEVVVGQTASGQVREKQIKVKVEFRLWSVGQDPDDTLETLEEYRESTYSETLALAKGEEESLLYSDMRKSIAEQLLWRLSSVKPANPSAATVLP